MIKNPIRIRLEDLPIGQAKIRILKTEKEDYGMHGQTGWDDLPYSIYHPAKLIIEQAHGILNWGPYRFRDNSREISGRSEMNILETECIVEIKEGDREQEVKEIAVAKARELKRKGFEVKFEFEEEPRELYRLRIHKWESNLPPEWIRRRYEKGIYQLQLSDLKLKGGLE